MSDLRAENRALRARLEVAESQLAAVTGARDIGLYVWADVSTDEIYFDETLRALAGVDPTQETVRAEDMFGLVFPDDVERLRAELGAAIEAGGPFQFEFRFVTPRGGPGRPLRSTGTVLHHADRAPSLSGIVVAIDREAELIANWQLALAELEVANERFRLVTAATGSGIWDWPDMTEDYIDFSQGFWEFLGYDPSLMEHTVPAAFDVIHPDDHAATQAAIAAVMETGGKYKVEFRMRFADGAYRHLRSLGTITRDAGGPGRHRLTGALIDAHEEMAAKRLLEAANERLLRFAAIISHDLGAPLRHITAFVEILREEHLDEFSAPAKDYLTRIDRSAALCAGMIDELHAYSREGSTPPQLRRVDLQTLCEDVRDHLTAGGRFAHLTWHIGTLPEVTADETKMNLLFHNLFSNAAKFSAGVSSPTVTVRTGPREGDLCSITVSDNGVGFEPRYRDKIFTLFSRAHTLSEFEGAGVGLANVARIVEQHGGRVEADGAPGEGATFTVWLPVAPAAG